MNRSKDDFEAAIHKLRNGELEHYYVTKDEFLAFREVLMEQKDKEKIIGEAKKGGEVVYTHLKE